MIENIKTIVIIAGAQRSGTTLVGQILGSHPQAFLIDEPDGLYTWFDAKVRGDETPELEQEVFEEANKKYRGKQRRLQNLAGKLRLDPSITHLILKGPNLTHRAEDYSRLGKPVSVVFPVRDPRAVVASMGRLSFQNRGMAIRQTARLSDATQTQNDFADEFSLLQDETLPMHVRCALIWRMKNAMREQISAAGCPTYTFRYEDLISDRGHILSEMTAHVGLPPSDVMLAHEEVYRGFGPGLTDRQRPIDSMSIESWRERLLPQEVDEVVNLVRDEMEAFGYSAQPVKSVPDAALEPMNGILRSPIILVGRGGSGTRLLSELGQQAGIFLGNRLNGTADSLEWADLIYEMVLSSTGPAKVDKASKNWERPLLARAAHVLQAGQWTTGQPWGWKLPETMLVVPQVCDAFTKSKVVHLVRHPVTSSLRRTHKTSRVEDQIGRRVVQAAYKHAGLRGRDWKADEDWRHNAVTWRYQVETVMEFGRTELGPERYMEVRYEDICSDPAAAWRPVAAFLGLPIKAPALTNLDQNRMGVYSSDDTRIQEIWALCGPTAMKLGYEAPVIQEPEFGPAASMVKEHRSIGQERERFGGFLKRLVNIAKRQ